MTKQKMEGDPAYINAVLRFQKEHDLGIFPEEMPRELVIHIQELFDVASRKAVGAPNNDAMRHAQQQVEKLKVYLAGWKHELLPHWVSRIEEVKEEIEQQQDPDWLEYVRLATKFGKEV